MTKPAYVDDEEHAPPSPAMTVPTQAQIEAAQRYKLRYGKYGPYFHDTERGGPKGFDMPLNMVLEKLNRLEEYTKRLARRGKR